MKVSNTPTNHIFIKAWTNNEFKCDFAIITLNENTPTYKNFIERVKERQELIKPILEKSKDYPTISFLENKEDIKFYKKGETDISFLEEMEENREYQENGKYWTGKHWTFLPKVWAFISISEEEIKNLTPIERQLMLYKPSIYFCHDGYFYIKSKGKLPKEEYYTEMIETEEFINSFL